MLILPGETIYSYLIRHCLSDGYPTISSSLANYFDCTSKQWSAQFPSFIPRISELSGVPTIQLINNHTVFPAYRHFMPLNLIKQIERLLTFGGDMNLESKMSLTANRIKREGVLKFCPLCVQQDEMKFGWIYWHVEHQLPGVLACTHHGCSLMSVLTNRKKLLLPPTINTTFIYAEFKALKISQLSEDLFKLKIPAWSFETLKDIYKRRLLERELATHNHTVRIRLKRWRTDLRAYWKPIGNAAQVKTILAQSNSWQFPANAIYGRDKVLHPLKHLLIIGHLFDTLEDFLSFSQSFDFDDTCKPNTEAMRKGQLQVEVEEKPDAQIIELLEKGSSMRSIAVECKVSHGYVKKLAQVNHIDFDRRTQFIDDLVRRTIWRKLFIGESTESIAQKVGVSKGAVEQVLSCNPELVWLRKKIRYFKARQTHRQNVTESMQKYNTRKDIRSENSASYAWLYKNDHEWLYGSLPEAVPRKKRFLGS